MKTKKEKKNIFLYVTGSGVSLLGSVIYSFTMGLYVLNSTGSGMKFATTLLLAFLPSLVITPFAGVFADRFDRKKIVVGMDILNGLLFLSVFTYALLQPLSLGVIYTTTFITNILTTFFGITFDSAKPQLVMEENLQSINSIGQIINAASGILGPMLGGLVFALIDVKMFILINGLSFMFSAVTELFIDFNYNKVNQSGSESFNGVFTSMKEGFIYLMGKRKIMKYFTLFVAVNIGFSLAIQVPLPYILNNHLQLNSSIYGIIVGVVPVGMIIGALLVGKVTSMYSNDKLFIGLSNITSIIILMVGIPIFLSFLVMNQWTSLIYFSIIMLLFGIAISLFDVPINTMLQKSIDEEYRGRAFGILFPMIKVINPIGYLVAGALLNVINPFLIPLIVGLLLLVFFNTKRDVIKEKNIIIDNTVASNLT